LFMRSEISRCCTSHASSVLLMPFAMPINP
jgi:hypothetical protein